MEKASVKLLTLSFLLVKENLHTFVELFKYEHNRLLGVDAATIAGAFIFAFESLPQSVNFTENKLSKLAISNLASHLLVPRPLFLCF